MPFKKADIIKRDGLNCYLCGKLLTYATATIEHVIPLFRGGDHKPENAKIACQSCNSKKGTKTLTEYKKYRGDYVKT
ncbi:MAG TPA: HNH endonuclease [Pyrinomonadaceae bacterium]